MSDVKRVMDVCFRKGQEFWAVQLPGISGLTGITIKGYRSFYTPQTVHFGKKFTLLYGPNSSGKSSFIDLLDLWRVSKVDGMRLYSKVEKAFDDGQKHDPWQHFIMGKVKPTFFSAAREDDDAEVEMTHHIEDASCYRYNLHTVIKGTREEGGYYRVTNFGETWIEYKVKEGISQLINVARDEAPFGKFKYICRPNFEGDITRKQLARFILGHFDTEELVADGSDDWINLQLFMMVPLGDNGAPNVSSFADTLKDITASMKESGGDGAEGNILEAVYDSEGIKWTVLELLTDIQFNTFKAYRHIPPLRELDWSNYLVPSSDGLVPAQEYDSVSDYMASVHEEEIVVDMVSTMIPIRRPLYPFASKWLKRHFGVEMVFQEATFPSGERVVAPRFIDVETGVITKLSENGEGLRQILPLLMFREAMIEQPELHLHPRLQGDLIDYLIDVCTSPEMYFKDIDIYDTNVLDIVASAHQHMFGNYILETHSEAIMLRIQRRIREGKLKPEDVAVNYFDKVPGKGTIVTHLRLDEDGNFIDEWPDGFFEDGLDDIIGGL